MVENTNSTSEKEGPKQSTAGPLTNLYLLLHRERREIIITLVVLAALWIALKFTESDELNKLGEPFGNKLETYAELSNPSRALIKSEKPFKERAKFVIVNVDTKRLHKIHLLYKDEAFLAKEPQEVDAVVLIRDIDLDLSNLRRAKACVVEIVDILKMETLYADIILGEVKEQYSPTSRLLKRPEPPYDKVITLLRKLRRPTKTDKET